MSGTFDFLSRDVGWDNTFHGLLHQVEWLGAAEFAGVSAVTTNRFFFRLPERPSPDAWAVLLGWHVNGDKLTPTRESKANWLLPGVPHPLTVTELCSGLGFTGIGFNWAGFAQGPVVEQSDTVCRLMSTYREGIIHSDVDDPMLATTLLLHSGQRRTVLVAGFSCQPWSSFGDSKGLLDSRAKSFRGVIRLVLQLRPVAAVLENVWACWQDPEVIKVIQRVCCLHGWTYRLHQMSL